MVTTTFLAPAAPAGVVQVMLVADATFGDVQALPSTVTVAPVINPVPVIVIAVSYLNCLLSGADLAGIFLLLKHVPSGASIKNNGTEGYWRKEN